MKGWCKDGKVVPEHSWTVGAQYLYPEQNCCVCGGEGCTDTPGWKNPTFTCSDYTMKGWCANGKVVPGKEWTIGPTYMNPESNCCACGKASSSFTVLSGPCTTSGACVRSPNFPRDYNNSQQC